MPRPSSHFTQFTAMMAEAVESSSETRTITTQLQPSTGERLVLRLQKPKNDKKVEWKEGVVDNEFMGKKKSKCCCIYSKPRKFNDSDDSDSDGDSDGDCCHEQKVARQHNHTN